MSAEAKMLDRHGWSRGRVKRRALSFPIAYWHDPADGSAHRQSDAIRIQRTRNKEAREAKREARA